MDSILSTIKKMLGIDESYEYFDTDIIVYINSAISTLNQLGVIDNYIVKDKNDTWSDLLLDKDYLESVKTYIYIKVRNIFDPPLNSFVLEALEKQASEIEWRLNIKVENEM